MFKVVFVFVILIIASFAHAGVVGDIDGDGQVGLTEAIYSLQSLSGIRPPLADAGQVKPISKYIETSETLGEKILMTVSAGKAIVITDILLIRGGDIAFFEKTTLKRRVLDSFGKAYHFNSGIPFSSGTNIIIQSNNSPPFLLFVSGYEMDQ